MNMNEGKDFKIVQVWPNQLVRTRKYEAALQDRNEAINREIIRAREEDIFISSRTSSRLGRKTVSIPSRRPSVVSSRRPSLDPSRKMSVEFSKREIIRAREDDILFSLSRTSSRISRKRPSVASRRPSFDPSRRTSMEYSKRRPSNVSTLFRPSRFPDLTRMTPVINEETEPEPLHFILPPLLLPPIHLGKPVDFKNLQANKYIAQT